MICYSLYLIDFIVKYTLIQLICTESLRIETALECRKIIACDDLETTYAVTLDPS